MSSKIADEVEVTEYPRYTVEVIIFEYAEDVSVGTERFLPELPPPEAEVPEGTELVFGDAGPRDAIDEATQLDHHAESSAARTPG